MRIQALALSRGHRGDDLNCPILPYPISEARTLVDGGVSTPSALNGRRFGRLNDLFLLQPGQLLFPIAEEFAVHLSVVLAQERRGGDLHGGIGQFDGSSG